MKIKRIISSVIGAAVLVSSLSLTTGCSLQEFFTGEKIEEPAKKVLTNREWLNMVNDAYGTGSDDGDPVDEAKEWGIIGEDEEIDLDAPVNDNFVSSTLARAAGYADADSSQEEIERAVQEHGLRTDGEDLSDPDSAMNALENIREDMVHPHFEDHREIILADNVVDMSRSLRIDDMRIIGDTITMPLDSADRLDKDSVFVLPGEKYGDEAAYKVIAIVDNGDDTADIKCVPASLCEVYKSVNVSGHFPADLNGFEPAQNGFVTVLRKNSGSVNNFSGYDKEKLMSEENDSIDFSAQLGSGCTVKISLKDIILNTKIDWCDNGSGAPDIKRIFLSADYISDVSLETTEDESSEKDSIAEARSFLTELPMEIGRVPVHICDGLTLNLDLSLAVNAEGELSVKVKTGETNGFEMKGAKFRTVNSVLDLTDIRTERRSWAYTTMNIAVGMDYLLNDEDFVSLDITSGPDVNGESEVHNGAAEDGEKLVCIDVNGFMKVLMNARFCNAVTAATGLDPVMKLLDLEGEKSRIKWEGLHYENGKRVAHCTFEENKEKETSDEETTTLPKGIFSLKTTYISICEGESAAIELRSLPSGYTEADLEWKSMDTSIVTVDSKGNITAVAHGNSGVSVSTKDGKYFANCAVVVKNAG